MEPRFAASFPRRARSAQAKLIDFADPAVWAWLAVAVMLVVPALSVLA
jgi:hypothetical protein